MNHKLLFNKLKILRFTEPLIFLGFIFSFLVVLKLYKIQKLSLKKFSKGWALTNLKLKLS